jgi:hypothetical protein
MLLYLEGLSYFSHAIAAPPQLYRKQLHSIEYAALAHSLPLIRLHRKTATMGPTAAANGKVSI